MSSRYAIYCLSHDPAVEAVEEAPSLKEAETWAAAGFGHHPACDLLVARYSGGLVEIGCPPANEPPGGRAPHRGHSGWHRDTVWADAKLLRVAAASVAVPGQAVALSSALQRLGAGCWKTERLHRLRYVLEVTP